jgi:hypothetical protein
MTAPEWTIDSATFVNTTTLIEPAIAILSAEVVLRAQVLNSDCRPPVPSKYVLMKSKPSVVILSLSSPTEVGTNWSGRVRNG